MTIRIVTDSTCDLPPQILKQYDISVVPCYINMGKESYRDGIDLSRRDFYNNLSSYSQRPKTSAPGIGLFREVFEEQAHNGATHIISMHVHSGLSNLSNAARLAAQIVDPIKITVIETGQLAFGLGFLVVKAAQAAMDGLSVESIKTLIKTWEERTFVYAALDTVDYLKDSGRVPAVVMLIANLLRIKPIVLLHKGEVRLVGQVRTASQGIAWLTNILKKQGPLEQLAVIHTNADEKAERLIKEIEKELI